MVEKDAKKIRLRKLIFIIVVFFFLCGVVAAYYSTTHDGRSKKGILRLYGWVEGTEVSLSSKVAGEVMKLTIDEGSELKIGDLVAQINSDQIQSKVANAQAQIAQAEASLKKSHNHVEILRSRLKGAKLALELSRTQSGAKIKQAEASLAATKAVLEQAKTNFSKAEKDYIRFSPLAEKNSISRSKMDSVEEAYNIAQSEVEKTTRGVLLAEASLTLAQSSTMEVRLRENDLITIEKELNAAETDITIAQAMLDSSLAQKKEIDVKLKDTFIYSPAKGTVTDKVIELGENVVPGTPVAVLTDMEDLYVKTYVEQTEIGKIKLNDPCRIYVDSFPGRHFDGRVIFVASKAEFTPRDVQMDEYRSSMVYKIKVGIGNPEGILKPGVPADIDLKWNKDRSWN